MDRTLWQVGELLRAEDLLGAVKNAYVSIGHLAEAAIGSNIGISANGFAISATTPTANMQVTIGRGSIYATQTVDSSAYGVLGTDATTIVKQGILAAPVTLTITAPGTVGYSQYYLVEVGFSEADANAVILPYYNSASTTTPLNGPSGGGGSNYTVRADQAVVQLKAGTAAATGSQTIPTPDSGFSPLWVILVANGTTQIIGAGTSAGQWTTSTIAPFFPNLESIRPTFTTLSNSVFTFSVSVPPMGQLQFFQTPTGATSAYTGTIVSGVLVPPGSVLGFYNSSTGAMTLNSNNFNTAYGSATASIVIPSGGSIVLTSDGTSWNGTGGAGAIGAAVRPQTAAGVGQWQYVPTTGSGASTYFTLPAGGSWAYMVSNSGAGTAGIAAGGSNVFGPFTASNLISFCWRIA